MPTFFKENTNIFAKFKVVIKEKKNRATEHEERKKLTCPLDLVLSEEDGLCKEITYYHLIGIL